MYIGVSICLESRAKEDNFTGDDWEDTGHGHYLNGFAGGTYSHSVMDANHQQTLFGFTVGDQIWLQYLPK